MHDLPKVIHLIDDTTAGGVMRVLDHIMTSRDLAKTADHSLVEIQRGAISLTRHKCDVIVSHLSISWRTLPALVALRLANPGKMLVHIEHSYTEGFVRHNVTRKSRFRMLLRTGFSIFDKVVAVSDGQAAWLRQARLCEGSKLNVIRSCVDLSAFQNVMPAGSQPKTFGAIGRLDGQKGLDDLIKAFRTIERDDIALHIYGTGDEREMLGKLAQGDVRIHFKGHVADPVSAYRDIDVLVVPSRWEAYGLVAIEALCAGRTVLCADIDGLADHAEYGAHLVKEMSCLSLAREMSALLTQSERAQNVTRPDINQQAQSAFVRGWQDLLSAS